ncbi:hypothetical protein [Gordonia terrae]|uniref:hypothetical protein n=1 Tax=Gordonia terrae TaxID=2055 RepID=UPI00039FCFC2
MPIPTDPQNPDGRKHTRNRQESFATCEDAEARRDELNAAKHTGQTSAPAEQKKAGELPFGYYAQAWIDSQQVKVAQGRLKQRTLNGYAQVVRHDLLPPFGIKAVGAISPKDCEDSLASLVRRQSRQHGGEPLKAGTVKHAWNGLRRVMKYAMQHGAIVSNPCYLVDYDGGRATGDREKFQHHPLTAEQVGQVSAALAGNVDGLPAYPVYALMVEFQAYSGLRASENSGLEIQDLEFTTRPDQPTRCTVSVRRTKDRKGGEWVRPRPRARSLAGRCPYRLGSPRSCTSMWPTIPGPTSLTRRYGPAERTAAVTGPQGSATRCRWTGRRRYSWARSTNPFSSPR